MAILFPIPENHPQRFRLHNEVHARPAIYLQLPVNASHFALTLTPEQKLQSRQHLNSLCERYGIMPPKEDADHFSCNCDRLQFHWEQHGEFSTYTFYAQEVPTLDPFSEPALKHVPVDWLANLPGTTLVAVHASIIQHSVELQDRDGLANYFAGNDLIGSEVAGGAAVAYTDFRIHLDGFSRFLILNKDLQPRQAGRLLQRLFEIEVYRVMALLAFPIARKMALKLNKNDQLLSNITHQMTQADSNDQALLDELTNLAAGVENCISTTYSRFDAANAYHQLVEQRIKDLRETRIQGLQTIGEFMQKRMEPAINTCLSTANRFTLLSERISNAGDLLRTRVDMTIERQNQALLTSMDKRAKIQLRLQETVESLSIVAISYYTLGLIYYLAKGLYNAGLPIKAEIITGIAVPIVVILVTLLTRRLHKIIQNVDH